jgi:phosphotransferase system  glucose/maltose/N-acetylglucosamine-specific IIC component
MLIAKAIIFCVALFLSIVLLESLSYNIRNNKEANDSELILLIIVCILWAVIYYLTHI